MHRAYLKIVFEAAHSRTPTPGTPILYFRDAQASETARPVFCIEAPDSWKPLTPGLIRAALTARPLAGFLQKTSSCTHQTCDPKAGA